jgi:hypothetical protein
MRGCSIGPSNTGLPRRNAAKAFASEGLYALNSSEIRKNAYQPFEPLDESDVVGDLRRGHALRVADLLSKKSPEPLGP